MTRLLADAVVIAHLVFVLFVVLGGLLVLRWPRLAWVQAPAAVWGAWIEFAGWICPLTPLENRLRTWAGEPGYTTGFVEHHLLPILYPASLSRELQWALGGLVVLINGAIYVALFRRRRQAPARRTSSEAP